MSEATAPRVGARALRALLYCLGVMVALQLLRMGLKSLFFVFVPRTNFSDRVGSFIAMALLSGALALRVKEGLGTAMLWKAAIGFGYGAVLGALRLGTNNCYSTMLLHGVLNIFGR